MPSYLSNARFQTVVLLLGLSSVAYGQAVASQAQTPQTSTQTAEAKGNPPQPSKPGPTQANQPPAPQLPASKAPGNVDPRNSAVAGMQQSIYLQTKSVAAQRDAQANSLALQRASLMKQAQSASPSFMAPFDNQEPIPAMPTEPTAPVAPDPTKVLAKNPVFAALDRMRKMDDSSFVLPWNKSEAMTMPNVRVPSMACPALDDEEIDKLSESAGQKNSIPPELIAAVMRQESGFHPCAVSTAGAMGLMQLMPETAQTLGVDDPFVPEQNVEAGARYLKQLLDRYHGDRRLALGAYNAGPARVDQANGVPDIPETQDYVERILSSLGEP